MEGVCRSDSHPLASLASVGVLLFQIVVHKLKNIFYEVSFAVDGDSFLGGSSCMVKITPNAPNLDHAKK